MRQETAHQPKVVINRNSPEADKIALFRSLFRGRQDVYPRRFERLRTGKSGYQPVCANEWVPGVCEKPRIKCSQCLKRGFLPVTDEIIRQHLSGRDEQGRNFVMGVYPMLQDETCHLLAVDFDGEHWREDAEIFMESSRGFDLSASLERSRSGDGGHVWFFFEEAISACLARQLGCLVLTQAMENRPDIGLRSYDRLFPNQDTLPHGGFVNLIALPLQKGARERGNSLFLDGQFNPHPDQWAFLASVRRVNREQAESLVRIADEKGRIVGVRQAISEEADDDSPWTAPPSRRRKDPPITGPLPESLELVLGDQLYVPKANLPPALRNRLMRLAAFQNPKFYRAQSMRLPTYDKPRIIDCTEDYPDHLALPRGCLDEILGVLRNVGIKPLLRDVRCGGTPLNVSFCGILRKEQHVAARAMLVHDTGVLSATTAFGKTVIAAWLIAQRGVNTLILVHRQQLLEQWVARLSAFLGVPSKSIGRLGGGRKKLTGGLDIALIQSLVRKDVVDDRIEAYGYLIADECHHLAARSFELVARRAKARFVTGLSATVTRKDGHHPIILMQCGPIRHRVDARQQAALRPFTHQVIVRPTGFRKGEAHESDVRVEFHKLYEALANDDVRNGMSCEDILNAVRTGRSPLLLTERTDHLQRLAEQLSAACHVVNLQGGMSKMELRTALASLREIPAEAGRVILSTGRFIGEGFDDPRLDTLFLALPVSWRGTIAQYVGRLHRLHEGKKGVCVYDYADLDEPMLAKMFNRRCRGYEAAGYDILLPASAVPGWPVEVPLPFEPEWKKDYAVSVRGLIRDGLDVRLACLFLHAARSPHPNAEGIARARSASEAFLYRRLATLPETAGKFLLNTLLPIPFNARGGMEVDFLCRDARLVIELDGAQHLSDAEAYRRDRRKDALLQQHGYLVFRFLAEDIGKYLDEVLDMILRFCVTPPSSVPISPDNAPRPR